MEELDSLRPANMLDNLACIIIDDVYTAVLKITGLQERDVPEDTSLEITTATKHADPDSPVLMIHCSGRHCCIGIAGPSGTNTEYSSLTSTIQKNKVLPDNAKVDVFHAVTPGRFMKARVRKLLHHTTIDFLSSTIYVARVGAGRRKDHWRCTAIRPDVANLGALGILATVRRRLEAAMLCQERLRQMAKRCRYRGAKLLEINMVHFTLTRMSTALDLEEIKRTICLKRNRFRSGPAEMETDEVDNERQIVKRMRTLQVS